jgi:hypothetical protein
VYLFFVFNCYLRLACFKAAGEAAYNSPQGGFTAGQFTADAIHRKAIHRKAIHRKQLIAFF